MAFLRLPTSFWPRNSSGYCRGLEEIYIPLGPVAQRQSIVFSKENHSRLFLVFHRPLVCPWLVLLWKPFIGVLLHINFYLKDPCYYHYYFVCWILRKLIRKSKKGALRSKALSLFSRMNYGIELHFQLEMKHIKNKREYNTGNNILWNCLFFTIYCLWYLLIINCSLKEKLTSNKVYNTKLNKIINIIEIYHRR